MPLVDYLLLTPLDEEWRTVRHTLCPVHSDVGSRPIDAITYYFWKQSVNKPPDSVGDYLIVGMPMSRKTPGQALAGVMTAHAVRTWSPGRVILIGIAGSLERNRLQLGDVVVSEEIYGYEVGDAVGRDVYFRPTFNQAGALDYDRVRSFKDDPVDYPMWQEECLQAAGTLELGLLTKAPELHLEVTASGNEVVKSVAFGKKLKTELDPRISAVEMEARGLHQALYQQVKRTDALMVRGISDYADGRKTKLENTTKDAWRTFCTANAARLLQAIWKRGPVAPLSPAYELDVSPGPPTRFRQVGIPNIQNKRAGAQNNAFPNLIDRSEPTPTLYLDVRVQSASGDPVTGNGLCIVHPQRQIVKTVPWLDNVMTFILPASESGLRVELLLSFPVPVDVITIVCRDDFQRSTQTVVERKKAVGGG